MPPFQYYNQTAPFWDFVASLEDQGSSHPWFGNTSRSATTEGEQTPRPNPWANGWGAFPFGTMPPGGWAGPPRNHGGPPPAQFAGPSQGTEESTTPDTENAEDQPEPSEPGDVPTPDTPRGQPGPRGHHGPGPRRGGRGGGRGRGRGCGGSGHRGRGGSRGGFPVLGGLEALAEMFQSHLGSGSTDKTPGGNGDENFSPEIDIFDTAESYVVHVSLPGAKKDDVGVNWDAEKSELSIAGVVHRPGDEDLLKTLAMNERKVGAFERKVRLGSRANPAPVDVEGITAKMEDGVLRVEVPKMESGFVEIKKVDIE